MKKIKLLSIILSIVLLLCGCETIYVPETDSVGQNSIPGDNLAEVHFIDVGQADATLIISNDEVMLIDTGDIETKTEIVNYLKSLGIEKINYLVLTHPHSDHIGGAPNIINSFEIEEILMSNAITTSNIFEETIDIIDSKGLSITIPEQGDNYNFGNGSFIILTDQTLDWGDDLNAYSLGLKVSFGDNDLIFTGDLEAKGESKILEKMDVNAEILKIGHHGSDTSTSNNFLEAVNPKVAIISCGSNNQYGHPHYELINKLKNKSIISYRTDIDGTVIIGVEEYSINLMEKHQEILPNVEDTISKTENIYILNINSKKIHLENCDSVSNMSDKNKETYIGNINDLLNEGYEKCKNCLE